MHRHGISGRHNTTVTSPISQNLLSTVTIPSGPYAPKCHINPTSPVVLIWSATDKATLLTMTEQYTQWLSSLNTDTNSADALAWLGRTLIQRRSLFHWRRFAVVDPTRLAHVDMSRPVKALSATDISLTFVFTGQGAQWSGMGKELLAYEVFRQSVADAVSYLMTCGCYSHLAGKFSTNAMELVLTVLEGCLPVSSILCIVLMSQNSHNRHARYCRLL
jgi:acyl transferase domain-containing protein